MTKPLDISAAARALGRKGGKSTSEAKQAAARANGKRGGRPRKEMTMKPGKYAGAAFTPDQIRARAMSNKAMSRRVQLANLLTTSPSHHPRSYWHERLDWYIDQIERLDADARSLFPDVEESFTIASMEIKL